MIDAKDVDPSRLSMTVRMIVAECQARNWRVELFYVGIGQMRITRDDGKVLNILNATPPTTSFVAGHFSNNKYLNHLLLSDKGMPVLETYRAEDAQEIMSIAEHKFFSQGRQVVVKPLDAAHGNGVTVGVGDQAGLAAAFNLAKDFSRAVIIQEQRLNAQDLRITCINYKFAAALIRVPARVKGDGQQTIEALIDAENLSPGRGENYSKPLNKINLAKVRVYLGDRIHEIPPAGEYRTVLGTANVGTGGETIDVTESLPAWLVEMAENCAKTLELPVCGIDFLVSREPTADVSQEELDPRVIESNVCPALFMHETPTVGQPRPVIKTYVDYLASV